MNNYISGWSIMCGSYQTDPCKKEYGAKNKIDEDFFNILYSTMCLHEIHRSQYEAGDSEKG